MRIFIVILWLILGVIYFWVWDRGVDSCCNGKDTQETALVNTEPESIKIIQKTSLPLAFNWNGQDPILGEGFQAYKDSILKSVAEGKILEITGLYRSDENKVANFENLGLARAAEIRKLFPEIPNAKIRFFSNMAEEKNGDKSNPFIGTIFKSAMNGENIKEVDDIALVYFPSNSTSKLDNAKIESYFDDVAERVIKSGEKVYLTGHTDSTGSEESNMRLGTKRANIIRDYLLSKGVPSSQINVSSKGEIAPIASNNSAEGRAKNRRVELKINKQ